MDVDIDYEGIERLAHDEKGPVARDLRKRARYMHTALEWLTPRGIDPHPAGDPRLVETITSGLGRDELGVYGWAGVSKPYALRVEFGFRGVDSLGRKYNQGPQPYLRPALSAAKYGRATFRGSEAAQRQRGLTKRLRRKDKRRGSR